MKQNRSVRLSVKGPPAIVRPAARAVAALLGNTGRRVEIIDDGSPKIGQVGLVEGTTDCLVVHGSQELAEGICLTAVLPRPLHRMCLLAVSGLTRPTVTNPTGLDSHAVVGVASSGQRSQMAAICPDLDLVEISTDTAPVKTMRGHRFDAILVPPDALGASDRKTFDLMELGPEIMLPPPGLGTPVILTRNDDTLGTLLKSLDDRDARACLAAEHLLAEALDRPAGLACLATIDARGGIRLQATLPREASEPRSALVRVAVSAPDPETAAQSCRFALEESLRA